MAFSTLSLIKYHGSVCIYMRIVKSLPESLLYDSLLTYLWQLPSPLRRSEDVVLALNILLAEEKDQLAVADKQRHVMTVLFWKKKATEENILGSCLEFFAQKMCLSLAILFYSVNVS